MNRRWEVAINHLERMADKDCTCTEEQDQCKVYPECPSCMASHMCNSLGELIDEYLKDYPLPKIQTNSLPISL